jgi:hypothetical protein
MNKKFSEWELQDIIEMLELISLWLSENGFKESAKHIENFTIEFSKKVEDVRKEAMGWVEKMLNQSKIKRG